MTAEASVRARPHVVIIGGGFGGIAAARGLADADVRVTLIDRRNHHLFQPLLYQVATAGLAPADIAQPIRSILAAQMNAAVVLGEVIGIDLDEEILEVAEKNARLNGAEVKFVQADLFHYLRDAHQRGEQFDVVILDPAKLTRDREQVIAALKKYNDMNKLAMQVIKPGGVLLTCSCTGLVGEEEFLDMIRRAAFYAGRTVQILKVAGAGADHPFMAHVKESRYLKAAFCRVE